MSFEPLDYVLDAFPDEGEGRDFTAKIFTGEEWVKADRGQIEKGELIEKLIKKYPKWRRIIQDKVESWEEMLQPIEGTIEILQEISSHQKLKLYVLSNFHQGSFLKVKGEYGFFSLFHGFVISGEVGFLKPEPKIYQILLRNYSLVAEETLFIDDQPLNIKGAQTLGIKGIPFMGAEDLRRALIKEGLL